MMSDKNWPTMPGEDAPLNPYDLPGEPRTDDEAGDADPTADESADVPGPGGDPVEPTTADTTDASGFDATKTAAKSRPKNGNE